MKYGFLYGTSHTEKHSMRNFKIETQCPFDDNIYSFRKVILK